MVQPGGELVGLDFSEERIEYAGEHYGQKSGIEFQARQFFLLTQIGI
jgi:ubiquinone/menaquinone biosynthesis C-methylase UbiE